MASAYVRTKREKTSPAGQSTTGNQAGLAATYNATTYDFAARSFQVTPGVAPLIRDDEIRGNDQPGAALKDKYNPTWAMNTRAYPAAVGYLLAATLGTPTNYAFTVGNGTITDRTGTAVPAGAYRHTWTAPFSYGVSTSCPPTMEMDLGYVDQSTYFDIRGAGVNTLTIENPDDDSTQCNVEGPCTYANDQASPGGSTVLDTGTAVFSKSNLSVGTWLSGTGSTADATLNIARNIESPRILGDTPTDGWPPTCEWTNDPVSTLLTVDVDKRFLDPEDVAALLDSTGFEGRFVWTTGTNYIVGSTPSKLIVHMSNAQYVDGTPEEMGNKRRHGATFSTRASSADGTTAAWTVEVISAVTASYNT